MNKSEFTDLIIHPTKLGNEHIDTLKKIVADYPYFSTAQILLAKALLNTHHYEYEKQLKTTALNTVDREVLHQFLNDKPEEIGSENSIIHVSEGVINHGVSIQDFDKGNLEQEALLTEAHHIIANFETATIESNIINESVENDINTEITLNLAETFLPDFDEDSLLTDEQPIETITKSVLPNAIPIINTEIEQEIIETSNEPAIISENTFIESFVINEIEEILANSETIIESNHILLENILDNESDNFSKPIKEISNNNFETIKGLVLVDEMADAEATIEASNLNFFEWLEVNKKESGDKNVKIDKPAEKNNYEDFAFIASIKQIIKTKAENNLINNIKVGIETAHDKMVSFERKKNVLDSIEENIKTVKLVDNFLIDVNIEPFNETNNDKVVHYNNKATEPKNYNYSAEVESILPDFEALNALAFDEEKSYFIYDKKEGLIPNYETPIFDPLFNSNFETKASLPDLDENETFIDFNDFKIDERLFENSFSAVYIPLPAKEIEKELEVQPLNKKTATVTNEIDNILDKFMRENPSISRPKTEFFNPASVAKTSVEEKDEIVSETLASIYLKQGLIKKSILTYEKLCLIYPHKNAYFATLINKIKTEHNIT